MTDAHPPGGAARPRRSTWSRTTGAILLALVGLLLSAPHARAQDTANWAGMWNTKWRGGGAQLELSQNGNEVSGTYPLYKGRIEARASGNQLVGRWIEGDRQGDFTFVQAPDGASFMGRFESATSEWWTGVRLDAVEYDQVKIDQSSPMAAMRTFLQAMNESGADNITRASGGGGMALAGKAASVVDVSEADRAGLNMVDYSRLLFSVIDTTTFRLWSLPHDKVAGDEITVPLPQFDTNLVFDVTFRRKGGLWFIVGQPVATLQARLIELRAARGTPVDEVSEPTKLRTPRDTFKVLLGGIVEDMGDPAYTTLDMRNYNAAVRNDEAALLARYLKKVIDRIGYVYWQELPDDPNSKADFVFFEHPAGNITVGPVETEDDGTIWQFTPDTLNSIRTLYADIEEMPVAPEFAAFASGDPYFETRSLAGEISHGLLVRAGPIERWQWLMLAVAIVLGVLFGFVANAVIVFLARRRGHARATPFVRVVEWSVRSIFLGLFLLPALRMLGLPEIVAAPVKAVAWSAIVIGAVPVLWFLIGRGADHYRGAWKVPGYHETLISLLTGVARFAVIIVALLLLAEVLAIPYQGVLAGLGIGGLAVALAAQPTLQNFLSGLTLYADRPVSVGDFCKFGDTLGTVEHIGMRSTRIRSADRTVISVPNSDFAGMQLENYAKRDRIRFVTTIQLRMEATTDQVRYVLVQMRKLMLSHPRVAKDPCRVRFVGIGASSLDIDISTYILTADFSEFLAIQEDILLRILTLLDEAGVQLAYPSQMEYSASDLPIDEEKRRAAEEKIRAWRADENLPFPDFDAAEKSQIADTLDYPPEGSVLRRPAEPAAIDDPARPATDRNRWGLTWRKTAAT
jgi:small-conductance mechanosensitive channel